MELCEVEFLAEQEVITIEPTFKQGRMYLISGDVGPFEAGRQMDVPLWLGLLLRQRHLCRILPPLWMDLEKLEEIKQAETDNELFSAMPSQYYREVTQLLLCGGLEIPQAQRIQTLVKDIWDVRQAKLRSFISNFLKSHQVHAHFSHLTPMEITMASPFLNRAMAHLHKLTDSEPVIENSATPVSSS